MKDIVSWLNSSDMPKVMGILNVTPDSFSDGGKFNQIDQALRQVENMISEGVDIIDIGGESTRPGAKDVEEQDEINRVIPVLKAIKSRFDVAVSIDTSKAVVMKESINEDADMINDVRALLAEDCLNVVAQSDVAVCLMHMQGQPRTMQNNPIYKDLIGDINEFFIERISTCENAGIDRSRIILDPGFGFGKTLEQNYKLLANFSAFECHNLPLLSGLSRKSMLGNLLNREVSDRLAGSLAGALISAQHGAKIIRVHDAKETVDTLKVLKAVTENK